MGEAVGEARARIRAFNGKRNKRQFLLLRAVCLITGVVLVETGDDAVAVGGDAPVEEAFGAVEPVGDEEGVLGEVGARGGAEVEIGVAEGVAVGAGLHPIVVHTEGAHEYLSVVAAQTFIERPDALGAQGKEDGVDELHDVVAAQGAPEAAETEIVAQRLPASEAGAPYVYVAGIVFPAIAVADDGDVVAEGAQPFCKGGVDVAVVADEEYFHITPSAALRHLPLCGEACGMRLWEN